MDDLEKGVKDPEETPSSEEKDVKDDVESSSTEKENDKVPETVPYEALQSKIGQIKELQEKIAGLESKQVAPVEENFDWAFDEKKEENSQKTTAPDLEAIEEEIAEQIASGSPLKALSPIIKQMIVNYDRDKEAARRLPDYEKFRDDIPKVSDDMLYQAMNKPELLRALLAKELFGARKKNDKPIIQEKETSAVSTNNNLSLQELKNKYIEEGKKQILEEMQNKAGQVAEGSATRQAAEDVPELDNDSRDLMKKLGITSDEALKDVANNLDAFLRRE